MSATQQNKDALRRLYHEAFDRGNVKVIDELVAEDVVEHEELPGLPPTREGLKAFVATFRKAFPDLRVRVHEEMADGDRVIARIEFTGTHEGEFQGIPPTHRAIHVNGIDIVRFRNGKVVEHWGVTDNAAMLQQLGALPAS